MSSSNLQSPPDRFLSLVTQFALKEEWLSAADVCEEFPPETIMTALADADDLRARLLIEAAGVHAKIAPKKSTSAAAEDLQIALDEGVCTPDDILKLLPVDELVQHLDRAAIWKVVTRDQFWLQDGARPQARMQHMIETGLEQDLLDGYRLLRAVTPEQLASDLPRELVEKALTAALELGLNDSAYDPSALLDTIGLSQWLEHLPLAHFWDTVIITELAPSANLEAGGSSPDAQTGPRKSKKKKKGADRPTETKVASPPPPSSSTDAETQAREQAINNLRSIERLPLRADTLRSPVLLGLDSMYADLLASDSDEERADLIREAFPNPAMLEEALYAMAETLDSRLTEEALKARGADTSSLIQLVLFEERRRANRAAGIATSAPPPPLRPASVPPPPTSAAHPATSGVPPLPPQARRASTPPPPLPAQARSRAR